MKAFAEGDLEYKDTIIIGDNSSGKSDVLRQSYKMIRKKNVLFYRCGKSIF